MTTPWQAEFDRLQQAWTALGGTTPPTEDLFEAWGGPDRHYHAHTHLLAGLRHLHSLPFEAPEEALVAWWFHDAIYDSRRHDNEEQSAAWARRALTEDGVATEVSDRVVALIMATCHNVADLQGDAALLVDVDLSVLGIAPEHFDAYEQAVRKEYAWVPEDAWVSGRRAVLQQFLDRERIYHHPSMHDRFEATARRNLARSLEALRK